MVLDPSVEVHSFGTFSAYRFFFKNDHDSQTSLIGHIFAMSSREVEDASCIHRHGRTFGV